MQKEVEKAMAQAEKNHKEKGEWRLSSAYR